jgi:hypothetical protein
MPVRVRFGSRVNSAASAENDQSLAIGSRGGEGIPLYPDAPV